MQLRCQRQTTGEFGSRPILYRSGLRSNRLLRLESEVHDAPVRPSVEQGVRALQDRRATPQRCAHGAAAKGVRSRLKVRSADAFLPATRGLDLKAVR